MYYFIQRTDHQVNKIRVNPKGAPSSRKSRGVLEPAQVSTVDDSLPLPHLSDHIAVATALDRTLDGTALFVLIAMYRAFWVLDRDQVDELTTLGLTPVQFNILTTLQRVGKPTAIGALGSMLIVRANYMSSNINALVGKGFIERKMNPHDSRSLLVELTKHGHAFLDQKLPSHWRRLEQLMGGLNAEERLHLVALLKKMVNSIQEAHHAMGETTG